MKAAAAAAGENTLGVSTLASGLTVVSERMPHVATVAVGVWVGVGARNERPQEHGLSHFIEHMAFKGTERRSARTIAEAVEAAGGDFNAETGIEHTSYTVRLLPEDLDLALDILADILTRSRFAPEEIAREKSVILQEISAVEDTPEDLVNDLFMSCAFSGQPLGRPILGTAESVRGFTRERLVGYLAREYRASRMVVAAAGSVDHARLVAGVERHFAGISGGLGSVTEPARFTPGDLRVERAIEQVQLMLGWPGRALGDDGHYALQVFANLLGGGMSSRLFQEVREERGLAYAVDAFHWPFLDTGVFGLAAGTAPEDVAELVPVALACLRDAALAATPEELARARAQMKVALLTTSESAMGRADQLARQMLAFRRIVPREEVVARLDALTVDDIRAAGRSLLECHPVVVGLGPVADLPASAAVQAMLAGK
ncbi:peptidase M16 [Chelatococcus daeguensis]|uniref:Peptidase M16 n=1 Tax=Chelatococcus daeguensis TaxID=444444 RepID=A0AAC9JRE3_9HYPH|nr:pitrilysin family protein [Chelatococcus daeguensis]APF36900.1 peptidase M16 [Chelatococcus daeguensis]